MPRATLGFATVRCSGLAAVHLPDTLIAEFQVPLGLGVQRELAASGAAIAIRFKVDDFGANASFSGLIPAFKSMQKYSELFRLMDMRF